MVSTQEWVSVREASRRLGYNTSSVYNAVHKGRLSSKREKNIVYVRMDRVLEAIADGRLKPKARMQATA